MSGIDSLPSHGEVGGDFKLNTYVSIYVSSEQNVAACSCHQNVSLWDRPPLVTGTMRAASIESISYSVLMSDSTKIGVKTRREASFGS